MNILKVFRHLLIFFAVFTWVSLNEFSNQDFLLGAQLNDFVWSALVVLASKKNGCTFFDGLLWVVLSRRLHINAMGQLEVFQVLIPFFWFGWSICFGLAKKEEHRAVMLAYHVALTFDAGMIHSIGLGMNPGWQTSPLDLMLISFALKAIVEGNFAITSSLIEKVFAISVLWLVAFHFSGPSGYFTCSIISTSSCFILFCKANKKYPLFLKNFFQSLIVGGLPLILVALGLSFLDNDGFWIATQRRMYAGNLHPNFIAAYSLLMLCFLLYESDLNFFPWYLKKIIRFGAFAIYSCALLFSGGRAALVILIISFILIKFLYGEIRASSKFWGLTLFFGLFILWRIFSSSLFFEFFYNERFFIWRSVWEQIQRRPLVGHGLLAYGHLPQKADPTLATIISDWNYPHAHQLLMEILLSGGLPLLLLFFFGVFIWWKSVEKPSFSFLAGIVTLLLGFFDFVWFGPSLIAPVLAIFFQKNTQAENPQIALPSVSFGFFALFLGAVSFLGFIGNEQGNFYFKKAFEAIRAGKGDWQKDLDSAVAIQPKRLQLCLQHIFFSFSTGTLDINKHLLELQEIEKFWPDYYLIPYLIGRIHYLNKEYFISANYFSRSVELEPCDTSGVRWGMLALARFHSGGDWACPSWNSICRGTWGPALILDHPTLGGVAKQQMSQLFSQKSPQNIFTGMEMLRVASNLAHRRVILTEVKEKFPEFFAKPFLMGLSDAWEALDFQNEANKIGIEKVFLIQKEKIDDFQISRLDWIIRAAARLNDKEVFQRALTRMKKIWFYRGKDSEYLFGTFLSIKFKNAKTDSSVFEILNNLLLLDPYNPWLIERLAEAHHEAGDISQARLFFEQSLKVAVQTRKEPFFSAGPRPWALGATGEQWTFAFEKALRNFDPEANQYNNEDWSAFAKRVKQKLARTF